MYFERRNYFDGDEYNLSCESIMIIFDVRGRHFIRYNLNYQTLMHIYILMKFSTQCQHYIVAPNLCFCEGKPNQTCDKIKINIT